MSMFYTHVRGDFGLAEDAEGQEFEDLSEAWDSALESARSIIADEIVNGRDHVSLELLIHDEAGNRLATCSAAAMVTGL